MLTESEDFCSNAPAGQSSPSMVITVEANNAKSVSFPIIPIKLGKVAVRVSTAAQLVEDGLLSGYVASDIVQRNILVVVSLSVIWHSFSRFALDGLITIDGSGNIRFGFFNLFPVK